MPARASASALKLLMEFAPTPAHIVPDPYYDGAAAFEQVLDLVEAACDGLVRNPAQLRGLRTQAQGAASGRWRT